MDSENRIKRLRFRAWHRGTREADYVMGGFFDSHVAGGSEALVAWFEGLIDEQDVDILAWAMGTDLPPPHIEGEHMALMRRLDYVEIPR